MMTPLQISTQHFTPNGKGGYKASEVDAFVQRVYKFYSKLYNDNNTLNERIASISPIIDEYNKNKAAIANALISAQSAADMKLQQADAQAEAVLAQANAKGEAVIVEKTKEAERYYYEKTHEADARLLELEKSYTALKAQADEYTANYLNEVNSKVDAIIVDANEKASVIVAKAYEDAKLAREAADKIIEQANSELELLKSRSDKIKAELAKIILAASEYTEIKDYAPIETVEVVEENITAEAISKSDLPAFNLDDIQKAAEVVEAAPVEDDVVVYQKKDFKVNLPVDEADFSEISGAAAKTPSKAEIPDVNDYLARIFDSAEISDMDFSFDDLISENK